MRQVHRKRSSEAHGTKNMEPLAEGLAVPLKKNGQRDWASLSDEEIIAHAGRLIEEKGITGRGEFSKADPSFYEILRKRKLLGRIGFANKRREMRDWASMGDEELVEHARQFVREAVSSKKELEDADMGLHAALYRRGLLDKVGFERRIKKRRNWASMSDEELVRYAKRIVEAARISTRKQLEKEDGGLYYALIERGLLDSVIPHKRAVHDWKKMSDSELLCHAKKIMQEKKISRRGELAMADGRLYEVLNRRKLLDAVFAEMEINKRDSVLSQLHEAVDLYTGGSG